jgi:hypothetical protein
MLAGWVDVRDEEGKKRCETVGRENAKYQGIKKERGSRFPFLQLFLHS